MSALPALLLLLAVAGVAAHPLSPSPPPGPASRRPPAEPGQEDGLPAATTRLRVVLLGRVSPREVQLRAPGRSLTLAAVGGHLVVDGVAAPSALQLEEADWRVRVSGQPERRYLAALSASAEGGRLLLVATMSLERYVAQVIASEARAGTPPAALAALAVVARSYALAAQDRHEGGALCDLAHCQLLRGDLAGEAHLAAARRAAFATAGLVLRLPSGRVAAAPFHAACGGQTADPRLAFGGDGTGAASVEDPGCPALRWTARLTPAELASALDGALRRAGWGSLPGGGRPLRAAELSLSTGPGGWVAQVAAADGAWRLSGDAAARALDAALGRGQVRSSRFTVGDEGGAVVARGGGHGHGVGLCQAGAARRASQGATWRAILAGYFPGARVGDLGAGAASGAGDGGAISSGGPGARAAPTAAP